MEAKSSVVFGQNLSVFDEARFHTTYTHQKAKAAVENICFKFARLSMANDLPIVSVRLLYWNCSSWKKSLFRFPGKCSSHLLETIHPPFPRVNVWCPNRSSHWKTRDVGTVGHPSGHPFAATTRSHHWDINGQVSGYATMIWSTTNQLSNKYIKWWTW